MTFDDAVREYGVDEFRFEDDPTIISVTFDRNGQKAPKGIPAGGIKIYVRGNKFKTIQNPQMLVYYEGETFTSKCIVLSDSQMECNSPVIDADNDKLDADSPSKLDFGFEMDNVIDVRNLSTKGHEKFELYPNPSIEPLEKSFQYLTLDGKNLNLVNEQTDVIVMVGENICNITLFSRQQLTCRLPTDVINSNK